MYVLTSSVMYLFIFLTQSIAAEIPKCQFIQFFLSQWCTDAYLFIYLFVCMFVCTLLVWSSALQHIYSVCIWTGLLSPVIHSCIEHLSVHCFITPSHTPKRCVCVSSLCFLPSSLIFFLSFDCHPISHSWPFTLTFNPSTCNIHTFNPAANGKHTHTTHCPPLMQCLLLK